MYSLATGLETNVFMNWMYYYSFIELNATPVARVLEDLSHYVLLQINQPMCKTTSKTKKGRNYCAQGVTLERLCC